MSKSTVIPKLAQSSKHNLDALCRIHDEKEDNQISVSLDNISPHVQAALDRLLGKAKNPE